MLHCSDCSNGSTHGEWAQVATRTFRARPRVSTLCGMKPFIPLFAGLAGWFVIASMVLTTFVNAGPWTPEETPAVQPAPPPVPSPEPAPLEVPETPEPDLASRS